MNFKLKKIKTFKIKTSLKKDKLLIFFHSIRLQSKEWVKVEQNLQTLKLSYYQICNSTSFKIFKTSIFKNFTQIITSSLTLFLKPKFKTTVYDINKLNKDLTSLFICLIFKLNNKFYYTNQINNLRTLCYKNNILYLQNIIEKYSKVTYIITK